MIVIQLKPKQTVMRNLAVLFIVGLLSVSTSFAGENPKLLKEIKRKLTIDLSGINFIDKKKEYVVVSFRVVDEEIQVEKIKGSKAQLETIMLEELEEMFIKADADPEKLHRYKFTFEKE